VFDAAQHQWRAFCPQIPIWELNQVFNPTLMELEMFARQQELLELAASPKARHGRRPRLLQRHHASEVEQFDHPGHQPELNPRP
jgi:hypothetical protein